MQNPWGEYQEIKYGNHSYKDPRTVCPRQSIIPMPKPKIEPKSSKPPVSTNCSHPPHSKKNTKKIVKKPRKPRHSKKQKRAAQYANLRKAYSDAYSQAKQCFVSKNPSVSPAYHNSSNGNFQQVGNHKKNNLKSHLHVAIIDRNHALGKVTSEVSAFVKDRLKQKLRYCLTLGQQLPSFDKWSRSAKTVRVVCKDDLSLEWLSRSVAELPPFQGASLVVIKESDLPKLTRVSFFVPGEDDKKLRTILQMLAQQNPNLQVLSWYIFHVENKPNGLAIDVGTSSMDTAEMLRMGERIHFDLSVIKVCIQGQVDRDMFAIDENDEVTITSESMGLGREMQGALNETQRLQEYYDPCQLYEAETPRDFSHHSSGSSNFDPMFPF